jgi:hypothetical protein
MYTNAPQMDAILPLEKRVVRLKQKITSCAVHKAKNKNMTVQSVYRKGNNPINDTRKETSKRLA